VSVRPGVPDAPDAPPQLVNKAIEATGTIT